MTSDTGQVRGFHAAWAKLFEEPVKVAQDITHVGRPGGTGRDVDVFSEERGVPRIEAGPKLDGLYRR